MCYCDTDMFRLSFSAMSSFSSTEIMMFGDFVRHHYHDMDLIEWEERYEMYLSWMDNHCPNTRCFTPIDFVDCLQEKISKNNVKICTLTDLQKSYH